MDSMSNREFLKARAWKEWREGKPESDQQKGVPRPAPEKPFPAYAKLVNLVSPDKLTVGNVPVIEVIRKRRSRRRFTEQSLTLEELSYLLWATQGITRVTEVPDGLTTFRTVPSGGSRHSFETYLAVDRVDGVQPGIYRYLPLEHKLLFVREDPDLMQKMVDACCGQEFVRQSAVVFVWSAIPYRMEWRYTVVSHKIIAIDAGHVCQNLYLAAESIGAGTCAIGAYFQDEMDNLFGLDGEDEFTIYAAPVGKLESGG